MARSLSCQQSTIGSQRPRFAECSRHGLLWPGAIASGEAPHGGVVAQIDGLPWLSSSLIAGNRSPPASTGSTGDGPPPRQVHPATPPTRHKARVRKCRWATTPLYVSVGVVEVVAVDGHSIKVLGPVHEVIPTPVDDVGAVAGGAETAVEHALGGVTFSG